MHWYVYNSICLRISLKLSTQEKLIKYTLNVWVILKISTPIHQMDSGMRMVGVILKQNENKLHRKDNNVIMLEVFHSTRLKPYLLSLLLSREQTQIQWWKGFIVFEELNGWWGFSSYEVLLQLMILSRGTMFCEVPQTTMRRALSCKIVVAALTVVAEQICRQPSLR